MSDRKASASVFGSAATVAGRPRTSSTTMAGEETPGAARSSPSFAISANVTTPSANTDVTAMTLRSTPAS
jgi:hypothetical protein